MRHKNKWGLSFLIIAFILLLIPFSFNITGAAIGTLQGFSYLHAIGFAFLLISILIFASRQTLDAIIIPTSPSYEIDTERTDKALGEHYKGKGNVLMITGKIDKPIKDSQVYKIYQHLRNSGIKPSQMVVEGKSKNTLENVLFSLDKLKKMGAKDVGIASNPSHLDRFEYIIKKAKEEGIIDEKFTIHRLETSENLSQKLYEGLANLKYRYQLRKGLPKK